MIVSKKIIGDSYFSLDNDKGISYLPKSEIKHLTNRRRGMKKLSLLFPLLFIMIVGTSASAIDKTGKVAIGGYGGYSFGFGDVFKKYEGHWGWDGEYYSYGYQFKVTSSFGAKAKIGLTENIALSFALNYQRTKSESWWGNIKESESGHWPGILANGILIPLPEGKTCPYLTGGVGLYVHYEKWDGGSDTDTKPGINAGGGIEYFFQDDLALDMGARLHVIFTEDKTSTYVQLYTGLNYYFQLF
jgi:hypothetical protein